jgi:hypothetical protein
MNKQLYAFLIASCFSSIVLTMENPASPKIDELTRMVRQSNAKEFKQDLTEDSYLYSILRTRENGNNAMHEAAYPFSVVDLEAYNIKFKRAYTLHQMARFHAYKVDLLLRDAGTTQLQNETNKQGLTPGVMAARNGYLPAMARIMLSNPHDWAIMIAELASVHKKTVLDSFLNYNTNPKILGIPEDLRVKLPESKLVALTKWAINISHQATPKNCLERPAFSWAQLDREQTKHIFECYLAVDILKQHQGLS